MSEPIRLPPNWFIPKMRAQFTSECPACYNLIVEGQDTIYKLETWDFWVCVACMREWLDAQESPILRKIRALIERGATEGEREAARAAYKRVTGGTNTIMDTSMGQTARQPNDR